MFDPIPTSDTNIIVEVRGRSYKAIRVMPIDAGRLNSVFEGPVKAIGAIFGISVTFTRVRDYYDEDNDQNVVIIEQQLTSSDVPPPDHFHIHEVDNSAVLATDQKLIVPASVFELQDQAAAYELHLRS